MGEDKKKKVKEPKPEAVPPPIPTLPMRHGLTIKPKG